MRWVLAYGARDLPCLAIHHSAEIHSHCYAMRICGGLRECACAYFFYGRNARTIFAAFLPFFLIYGHRLFRKCRADSGDKIAISSDFGTCCRSNRTPTHAIGRDQIDEQQFCRIWFRHICSFLWALISFLSTQKNKTEAGRFLVLEVFLSIF